MELTQQQVKMAVDLKGQGLYPSVIADTLGLPRGTVKKFFKERRRSAMNTTSSTSTAAPGSLNAITDRKETPSDVIDGFDFELVKRLRREKVSMLEIARRADRPYSDITSWYARMCRYHKAAEQETKSTGHANVVVDTVTDFIVDVIAEALYNKAVPHPKTVLSAAQLAKIEALYAQGTNLYDIAYVLGVPPGVITAWDMRRRKAIKIAERKATRTAAGMTTSVLTKPVKSVKFVAPVDAAQKIKAFTPTTDTPYVFTPPPVPVVPAAQTASDSDYDLVALAWTGILVKEGWHNDVSRYLRGKQVAAMLGVFETLKGIKTNG